MTSSSGNSGFMQDFLIRICLILIVVSLSSGISAQTFKYVGAAKCKMCHNKAPKGEQYNKWSGLKHANALESLKNQKSIDYAKKNGLGDPINEAKCLKCHSTAASIDPKLNGGIKKEEGVSCESCHGPGSLYKSPAVMKNREVALKKGLIIPDKELCEGCHNSENPFHPGFDYESYLKKIAHPDPTRK